MSSDYKQPLMRNLRYYLRKSCGKVSIECDRLQKLWKLEDKIFYQFSDWELLNQSLTHKSYAYEVLKDNGKHYEMLEFLGDAVLDTVISHLLMKKYPEATEGELSKSRSSLVNTKRLSILARQFGLGEYILLGKGEDQSQGRSKPTILTCVYEAVIGAIYLDGGFDKVAKVIYSHFEQLLSHKLSKGIYRDFKSRLQEYVQGTLKTIPEYHVLGESGPPHAKEFAIHIKINGKVYGSGRGKSKKEAQQRAAMATLKQLDLSAKPPSAKKPNL